MLHLYNPQAPPMPNLQELELLCHTRLIPMGIVYCICVVKHWINWTDSYPFWERGFDMRTTVDDG